MPLRQYKPTSPSRRGMSGYTFEEISKSKPEKALLKASGKRAGRNNQGRITVRHQGGGHKRRLRVIDFKRRDKLGVPGKVVAVEYDPNRSARIALISYVDGDKRYILAPVGLRVGGSVMTGPDAEIAPATPCRCASIPTGTIIHNVELHLGKGAQIVRSAGAGAQLMAKEGDFSLLRLPSGEMRRVHSDCLATIGQVGNVEHANIKIGKAGRNRWLNKRPTTRGTVMNPNDHPHGGGEGRAPIGMPGPKTPWGKPTLGYRTRRNKTSDKFIVRRRNQ